MVEHRRTSDGRVVQRQVLYRGEINDRQQAAWRRTIEVLTKFKRDPQSGRSVAVDEQS